MYPVKVVRNQYGLCPISKRFTWGPEGCLTTVDHKRGGQAGRSRIGENEFSTRTNSRVEAKSGPAVRPALGTS